LNHAQVIGWVPPLIATQIIEEIKRVDPKEQWERPPLPCPGEESGEGCELCDLASVSSRLRFVLING